MLTYGSFLSVGKSTEEEVKKLLVENMKRTIEVLAEDDRFWIVTEPVEGDPLNRDRRIAWKIQIPHMDE